MCVADPYMARSEVRASHLPFEGFLEALCRVAALKALPDDAALEVGGFANAGAFLCHLRENASPEEHAAFLKRGANEWGEPPKQPLARCVDHLIAYVLFMIERGTRGDDDMKLDEKEVALYFGAGGGTSGGSG